MNLPFCERCRVKDKCTPNLEYFQEVSGNKRIPPESYCKEQHLAAGIDIGDYYRNVLLESTDNPTSLYQLYPDLKDTLNELNTEWRSHGREYDLYYLNKMPLSVTLMLTEKCNLACKYCYERFSGNIKPKTMSKELIDKSLDYFLNPESLKVHQDIIVDLIGGEIFVEFDLLRYTVDQLLKKYKELGICPRKTTLSLCSNASCWTPEIKDWLLKMKQVFGRLSLGISLDGIKECHDLGRCNSFDRVMENFEWWRTNFPDDAIKGTISPPTLKYLYENVKFFVEDLQLPRFYINPTFEGPWTDDDVILYGDELIKCAEFFLERPDYGVLNNSNLFAGMQYNFEKPRKGNWCGSGVHMVAVGVDGTLYPCLRAATSNIMPLGTLDTGRDKNKLVQFYLYTQYNDDQECQACEYRNWCPSCVMQWVEDTGDMFVRSRKMCGMTKARILVSKWYYNETVKNGTAELPETK